MILVKATREGLVGGKTSTGYKVEEHVPFVALPSTAAKHLWVRVVNPANGKACKALVLDLGPWNTKDHKYVFQPATVNGLDVGMGGVRPLSESVKDEFGRNTNSAGIDLGEKVWALLGMHDNGIVGWEFVL